MLVLTPKYGSQIDIDLLNKQKAKHQDSEIKHRQTIDLNQCEDIDEAYYAFLNNKDKYILGYKPKNAVRIYWFAKSFDEIDTLDVSWIDVSELDELGSCFKYCKAKHIVGLEKWDVRNVKIMSCMFNECKNLESIDDISGWDISNNVKDMDCMFEGCEKLKSIDISRWDVTNVKFMNSMFERCKNLESVGNISGWNVSNVANMWSMFKNCEKLKNVGNLERWQISKNVFKYDMFLNCAIKPIPSWYHHA